MTKLRTPSSVEDALNQAIGYLGVEEVGQRLGKSASLVRKYADPDDESRRVPAEDMLTIDRWLAQGGYPQAFALLVAEEAEHNARLEVELEAPGKPLAHATRMVCAAADIANEVQKAAADGVFDPGEVAALLVQLERFHKQIAPLRKALFARRRAGR